MKTLTLLTILNLSSLYAENNSTLLHEHALDVQYTDSKNSEHTITIARDTDIRCKKILLASGTFWSENYANSSVPEYCKKTFITTYGNLSPIKIDDDVETYGELEVLEFIEEMQEDSSMLLIDTRKPFWYKDISIPTAINIPFEYFAKQKEFHKDFLEALKILGVKGEKKPYNFQNAKTLTLFCNASWCTQSSSMVNELIQLGYPTQKLKWYRGGLSSWLGLHMTSTRDK